MKRILLVYPEFPVTYWGFQDSVSIVNKKATLPPLGLITLAACLPESWELRLIDLNVDQLRDDDIEWADVVFLGGMLIQLDSMREVIERTRRLDRPMVVGGHTATFPSGLRSALRQDPDVILVGEMRDLETMEAAITAAETGHLVFGTLHTTGAARTVDRIVDAFPTSQQEQVRTQLASSLVAVVSQLLLVRQDKPGRIAAFEIMIATPGIRSLIRDNKTFRITSDIQTGARWGMVTLDAHLLALYERNVITYEDVITKAQDPDGVLSKLQGNAGK